MKADSHIVQRRPNQFAFSTIVQVRGCRLDEGDAIARLKHGDVSALAPLVRRYQWDAVRAATLITRDRHLAEEIVQEAFVRVYERIDQFDSERPFAPWFFRIVTNDAVKLARRSSRQPALGRDVGVDTDSLIDATPDPEDLAVMLERSESIAQALDQLPPEQRAAIVLHYYLGMTDTETAERLGSNRGTIKWRLHAARQKLRTLLRTYDPHPLDSTSTRTHEEQDR